MNTKKFFIVTAAVVVAAILHAAAWRIAHEQQTPPDVKAVMSVSLSPFQAKQDPTKGAEAKPEDVARDLEVVAGFASGVRTYSVAQGQDVVALLASERPRFRVVLGAWISADDEATQKELTRAITLANSNKSVVALSVGNETLLRQERTIDEMLALLKDARRKVKRNTLVTTSETWDVWIQHPELADAVDYVSAHILPYWEGVPADAAVEYAFQRYDELQARFPDKKIVIGEFGWPSKGYNNKAAYADPILQAQVVRAFIAEAARRGVEYNIIEAIDQPWKRAEGIVGAYWGILDAKRQPKFSLEGLVAPRDTLPKATAALLLGAILTIFGLGRRNPTFGHALAYSAAANALGAGMASAAWWPFETYLTPGTAMMWGMGVLAIVPLSFITLAKVHEIAEVILGHRPRRLLKPRVLEPGVTPPKVSIQIPAYKERPEMLIETLNAVAALDYPNFEALVIINNTADETLWRPVEAHCLTLGERFKFINLPSVKGAKAGALNEAMAWVDPDAEILALIDADYVVSPEWLSELVGAFDNPKVALVQAPQDHRDGGESPFKSMMDWEYAGFFDIGMIQRNEYDAIVAHGTMLLIRRSAFEEVGGWQSDTIVEDTELGLRLFEAGYSAQYTNKRYGFGLLPDTFEAYRTQRHRWAYGSVQIIRKHWRHLLPGSRTLTSEQKSQYFNGWFHWLSDALGVVIAFLNLGWVPLVLA
ncbi:MAG TPA: glycosyltransferase family 2 protein, partial [Magnetovibrio sp.]